MKEPVFELLCKIEENQNVRFTQRELAEQTNISLGSVNSGLLELQAKEYILENDKLFHVTEKGYAFLDKHRVDHAILMAAGFGSRLLPLTLETPKPLIAVNGKPMIETVIEGLQTVGIKKIYIVLGYRKEDFYYLQNKYANIEFIVNKDYTYKNNISTMYYASEIFKNGHCCVCEADLVVNDVSIFKKYIYKSQYLSEYVEGKTGEWIFHLKYGRVTNITVGGENVHTMIGISHWLPSDAELVANAIKVAYSEPGHETLYWDDIVTRELPKLDLRVSEVVSQQITEIDTLHELIKMDKSYEKYLDSM